ncbi:FGGY-family carbohydrate kinase [Devosia chinhatensis]|uniref:FGGY-family carbohydrate kinase n=1 Tax=Devosia chinhatensis TaxID=429727 RepID=UPI000696192A|nr:FGGY-family carbohydrate kinase [Devosia chinhatensis]
MSSSPPRHIAVIDIGKTNAKVVVIDRADGVQRGARTTPNIVLEDIPYPHMDVERLWAFIIEALADLGRTHGIDGISITTHGACGALVNDKGLVLPVLDYESDVPDAAREAYERVRPDFSETLSPRLPGGLNWGAQLFWQSRAFPDAFGEATAILPYPQYWAWRLTGTLASEVTSLGCHTDLWAPDRGDYSSMVDALGWRSLFPPLRPAASVIGTLLPEIAAITGLAADLPVACGIHDSNASLVPHLGRDTGPQTILSSGTWTILMTLGGKTSGLDPRRDSLANVDAHGRPVPTARFMGGREFDLLVPQIVTPTEAEIAHVIDTGIMALPSFVPGVGPFGLRTGGWTQASGSLTPGQRNAAASLYLALMAREALDLCGLGRSIVIEGPLARNRLFGQALARLAGVPVRPSGDSTGTSLGASLLFGGGLSEACEVPACEPLHSAGFDLYVENWRRQLSS